VSNGNVGLLVNRGNGTFDVSAAAVPNPVVAAGVSSTGHPGRVDVVTVDLFGTIESIPILPNGALGQAVQIGSPFTGVTSGVAGDFNHDGRLDFALGSSSSADPGSVTLLLGRSDGTFTTLPSIAVGGGVQAIAAADFNGDGNLDLAVSHGELKFDSTTNTNRYVGGLDLLLGKGDGTFQAPVNFAPQLGLGSLAIADVDGDARPDVVAIRSVFFTGAPGSGVAVFLNNGAGGFGTPHVYDVGMPVPAKGSHTYSSAGALAFTVTIKDSEGSKATVSGTATVAAQGTVVLGAAGSAIRGTEGVSTGSVRVASFTDTNPNATASQFTANIAWGDGNVSAGVVTANSHGGFDVSAAHAYAEEGSYAISVTISDGAAGATANGAASIADAALHVSAVAVSGTAGASTGAVPVASFTDDNPSGSPGGYTASIDWGDGSAVTAGVVTARLGGGFDVTSTGHTYAGEGSYAISITVRDAGGASAAATANALIADAALHVNAVPITGTARASTGQITVATFTDDDPAGAAQSYSASIDWGDGSPLSGGSIVANASGGFDVLSTGHTYLNQGSYAVSVTIADHGGSSTTTTGSATIADAALRPAASRSPASWMMIRPAPPRTTPRTSTGATARRSRPVASWLSRAESSKSRARAIPMRRRAITRWP
jgi:FG-GAP-like repeat